MDPNQAVQLLDQITAQVALTRQEHTRVMEALQLLYSIANPPASAPPPEVIADDPRPRAKRAAAKAV